MLAQVRWLTLKLTAEELGISKDTAHTIVRDDLDKRKICSWFVPHTFTDKQKANRIPLYTVPIHGSEDGSCAWPSSLRTDLAPADFFLFPRLKAVIKGARFADMNANRWCDSRSAIDSTGGLRWLFPEAVRTLSNVYCSGWRLLWRAIKKICLYLLFCLFSGRIHRTF